MGDKSVQKKKYIVEKAREVFAERGYKSVTMKDIVEACDISRGGLYLYFDSTKTLFEAVLEMEAEESDDVFAEKIQKDATASDIIALFLLEQKKEILRKKENLSVATYEFFFEHNVPKKDNQVRQKFEIAVKILKRLIQEGVDQDEFYCDAPLAAARNIMFVIEGLKITAQTIGVTSDTVEKEFAFLMQGLERDARVRA